MRNRKSMPIRLTEEAAAKLAVASEKLGLSQNAIVQLLINQMDINGLILKPKRKQTLREATDATIAQYGTALQMMADTEHTVPQGATCPDCNKHVCTCGADHWERVRRKQDQ